MKFSVWDALSILTLMGLCVVGVIVASIFANPASAFNPFPPPTLPAGIVLPSGTPTAFYMPPTWTPVGNNPNTIEKVASQTPLPTSTGFVLPSFTPTFTVTPSPTLTETPTETDIPTDTKVPHTATPKPTIALVCLSVSQSISLGTPLPDPTTAGSYSGTITVNGDPSYRVSGASVSFSTSKKTTVGWTCSGTNASCPASGKSFSVSSIKMFANGTVTININGVIPKNTKSSITFKSTVHAPGGTSNQCNPNASTTLSW
jgi:hypothetical protein